MDGMAALIPPAGDAWTVLTQWRFEPLTVASLLGVGSLYAVGVLRSRRSGRPWDGSRTAWFVAGLACLAGALVSPIDAYADVSFAVHMAQHLMLTLAAPPLLALGAPMTLALRAASPETARRLSAALKGRVAVVLAKPIVGWGLFVGVPIAVHASPLFDTALRSNPWHGVEHGVWLVAALVFWWPIVGVDPNPHPVAWPIRLVSLFLVMPAMSFLAMAIYSADVPLYPAYAELPAPWGPRALADQRDAAVAMWLVGNLFLAGAILVVAASWKRDDDAKQRRLEAREDQAGRSTATASTS
jgi:putative membrane protein